MAWEDSLSCGTTAEKVARVEPALETQMVQEDQPLGSPPYPVQGQERGRST